MLCNVKHQETFYANCGSSAASHRRQWRHVDRATYSFHETGKTQPNLCRIGELAKIFAIPVEVLVDLLANPEKTERSRPKSRAPKRVSANPDSLGQLFPEEKSLIAVFRRCDSASQQEIYQTAKQLVKS